MDEQKAWLGRGWALPVGVDPATGGIALAEYEADIRQSILIILHTAKGERVMRPDFGCGIHDLVFEVVDVAMLTRVEAEVTEALRRYEARIDVMRVRADPRATTEGKLLVELEYRVRRTNQIGNLVFPFYFREGGVGMAEGSRR
jgi:phage baseplate assembly protein W